MNETLQIELKGGLLLGGGGALELHNATLRRADGVPYIPASAIKGAVREQLSRLCGDPAVVDRIFGTEGWPERNGGPTTKVYFTDARLPEEAAQGFRKGYGYGVRPQVSIDLRSRHAAAERLFQREIIAPFAGLVFAAGVDTTQLDEADRKLLGAAVEAVFALGAARSTGLGRVEMSFGEQRDTCPPTPDVDIPEEETLELVLEAVDPVCVGTDWQVANFRATQLGIPASTLRGAVVTAALRHRKRETDQSNDAGFHRLVLDPETCLRFGDAIPLDDEAAPPPRVAPLTLRTCKHAREKHGVGDTLLRDFVHHRLADAGFHVALDEDCPVCTESPSRTVPAGLWIGAGIPERRVMTRLALDAETARGQDGKLFSVELLERGTRFLVRLANVSPEARKLLQDAMRETLRVGHGRGQGYGRLRLVEARSAPGEVLGRRLREFDAAVRVALAGVEETAGKRAAEPNGERHYLAATLTSDMLAPAADVSRGEEAFAHALGLPGAEVLYGQVRTGQRGGFHTRARAPKAYEPVVLAGSVLLLAVDSPFEGELLERLRTAETHGIGTRREEGYGWVRFSDTTHQPGWRKP